MEGNGMMLKAHFRLGWVRALGIAGAAFAGYVFGITSDSLKAQNNQPAPDRRVVAYIYGNIPVSREELGDYLIARGGYEKLELFVNKKIIEIEAAKRNLTVTSLEVDAGLAEDLRGMGISKDDFAKHILPRYHKTLYEWTEDVIKPRILLGKMCQDRVKVTEEDLNKAFLNRYGERRQAKVICWNREDLKAAQAGWDEARKGEVEFDRVARTQADSNLAASAGLIAPIGQFPDAGALAVKQGDEYCTKVLFSLKVGEISQLFQTSAGIMCVKCVAIIPKDETVKLEGKIRDDFQKEVYDRKLSATVPEYFAELKKVAQPNILLVGPPGPKEFRDGVNIGIQQTGLAVPTAPLPGPAPKP
jgi:hypothetical protein